MFKTQCPLHMQYHYCVINDKEFASSICPLLIVQEEPVTKRHQEQVTNHKQEIISRTHQC